MVSIPQYSDEWRISLASRIHNCCIARLQRESVVVYFWENSIAAEMRCFGTMMSLLNWDPFTMWPIISGWNYLEVYIFLGSIDLLVCINTYTYIYNKSMPPLVVQNPKIFLVGTENFDEFLQFYQCLYLLQISDEWGLKILRNLW